MTDKLKADVQALRELIEAQPQDIQYVTYLDKKFLARLLNRVERLERNRDMWKGQVERQAEDLTHLRGVVTDNALDAVDAGERISVLESERDALLAAIRRHRADIWEPFPVQHDDDARLYEVLAAYESGTQPAEE